MARSIIDSNEIRVAVVTGGHPYDVPGFRNMFDRMPQVRYYIQDLDNWAYSSDKAWDQYDVHLFYNMHASKQLSVRKNADDSVWAAIDRLGDTKQGVLVLHHALLAFQDSQTWSDICGIQDRTLRGYAPHEHIVTRITNPDHPITQGLQDWSMVDEPYVMDDAGSGSDVLLTANHSKSMKTIAWVRKYKKARVFCYEGGHDNQAYTDPTFQTVLLRGIKWVAGKV